MECMPSLDASEMIVQVVVSLFLNGRQHSVKAHEHSVTIKKLLVNVLEEPLTMTETELTATETTDKVFLS